MVDLILTRVVISPQFCPLAIAHAYFTRVSLGSLRVGTWQGDMVAAGMYLDVAGSEQAACMHAGSFYFHFPPATRISFILFLNHAINPIIISPRSLDWMRSLMR